MKFELEKLYKDKYNIYVKRMIYRVGSKENAEDVVQDAFCNAFKYFKAYDKSLPLEQWFKTILNNSARRFKKQERMDGMSDDEGTEELDEISFTNEIAEKIADEIENPNYASPTQEVLRCFYLEGWLPRDIAKISSLSPTRIREIIYEFKGKMQRKYGEDMRS